MILFDKGEQEARLANRNDAWMDVFRYILGTQIFVAVGLSGRDPMANLVIAAAERQRLPGDKHPVGFWFFKEGSLDQDYANNLKNKGVVLVAMPTYESISSALFQIAQNAAGQIIV